MRGETREERKMKKEQIISIHSPHARGDPAHPTHTAQGAISIHSPHARGDRNRVQSAHRRLHFNPLPSCEGRRGIARCSFAGFISIHSPHARGDDEFGAVRAVTLISIHSPHARGDGHRKSRERREGISIHSPHARGDACLHPIS